MSAYIPEGYSWSDNIIKSVNWIISCFSAIWNGCWLYMINPLISWVTGLDSDCIWYGGKTLAVRILCAGEHTPKMTDKILDCIMHEDRFAGVMVERVLLFRRAGHFVNTRFSISMILQNHSCWKRVSIAMLLILTNCEFGYWKLTIRFKSNVDKCFHQLMGTNVALKITDTLKNEKYWLCDCEIIMIRYDRQNPDHEALLMDLWSLLRPNIVSSLYHSIHDCIAIESARLGPMERNRLSRPRPSHGFPWIGRVKSQQSGLLRSPSWKRRTALSSVQIERCMSWLDRMT